MKNLIPWFSVTNKSFFLAENSKVLQCLMLICCVFSSETHKSQQPNTAVFTNDR